MCSGSRKRLVNHTIAKAKNNIVNRDLANDEPRNVAIVEKAEEERSGGPVFICRGGWIETCRVGYCGWHSWQSAVLQ